MGIKEQGQITIHSLRGALFETWVVAELIKGRLNRGLQPNLYFWRDSTGNEVDVLAEQGERLLPIEIKSGQTVTADYFAGLNKWLQLAADSSEPAQLVYAGDDSQQRARVNVIPWQNISILAEQI